MRVALVGTRGVPARYGGFETCVEEVGARLADRGHDVLVYARSSDFQDHRETHRGMTVKHLPAVRHKALETLSHTALSVAHLLTRRVDVAIVFNAANALFLPLIRMRRIPVATHVDGLEWKRAKWGGAGRRYYRMAEAMAVRWSDDLIADAAGIAEYYRDEFGAASTNIAYGAPLLDGIGTDRLTERGLRPGGYHLVVARFEPENHVHVAVDAYVRSAAKHPLVVVGSAPYSDEYTARIRDLASSSRNVRFLGAVWDQILLDQLYAGAFTYVHGHSVGGTNPSLLRAMGASAPTIAFDVRFNREVLGDAGHFFTDAAELSALLEKAEADPAATASRGSASRAAAARYDWDDVAEKYERLCVRLAGGARQPRVSGRRKGATDANRLRVRTF
ncbi:DUF1972 domain-containing protein [Fodinicola acaciae]|uniref:DUF1972 domain-containing protein n=1 Tax=Fodinicola acaciae TaxID=2681555 RepID=UPI0013D2E937|nr:DUF1972 domain-containing protein [Fodinicola acaciae]